MSPITQEMRQRAIVPKRELSATEQMTQDMVIIDAISINDLPKVKFNTASTNYVYRYPISYKIRLLHFLTENNIHYSEIENLINKDTDYTQLGDDTVQNSFIALAIEPNDMANIYKALLQWLPIGG